MTSALSHSTQSFDALTQDVNEIYSKKDKTTQSYARVYSFEENNVSIAFERVWVGQAAVCGIDMKGSAKVTMQKRDTELEKKIILIIQGPTFGTLLGTFPVVNPITIK